MSSLFDLPFEDDPGDLEPAGPPARPDRPSPSAPDAESRAASPPAPPAAVAPPTAARAAAPDAPARRVLSVTELTVRLRDLLETEFQEIWVEGEISNCRRWNTGHVYFTLKDGAAQIRAVMFRSALRYLKFTPEDGAHVIARGRISVYEPKGEYQIVCEHLEPRGLGALQLAFEQLKKRLQAEGLFDDSRKRPLPVLPRRIGIVTSLDGAAIRDIIQVLRRRHAGVHLVIAPTRVQGDGAAADIAAAVRAIGRVDRVDVIIVARGGGSIEDLWAFNEEPVARAIASAPVPVISAVGHEVDFTIGDFVADLRAPTPSAAAEIVIAAKHELRGRIDRLAQRLAAAAGRRVQILARRVDVLSGRPALAGFPGRVALRIRDVAESQHAMRHALRNAISAQGRRLQSLDQRLDLAGVGRRLGRIRTRLVAADGRLDASVGRRFHRADSVLRQTAARLDALSPLAVLGRGYAVCWDDTRTRVIRDADDTAAGGRVRVTLARGELECDVRAVNTELPGPPRDRE